LCRAMTFLNKPFRYAMELIIGCLTISQALSANETAMKPSRLFRLMNINGIRRVLGRISKRCKLDHDIAGIIHPALLQYMHC